MYLARIKFGKQRKGGPSRYELEERAMTYMWALARAGQIEGHYFFAWDKKSLIGITHLARPDSFKLKYHQKDGRNELRDLKKAFGCAPAWKIIGDRSQHRFQSWRTAKEFCLVLAGGDFRTPMIRNFGSPIIRLDSGEQIPAYLLPLNDDVLDHLSDWRSWYHTAFHASGPNWSIEISSYKELAEHDSDTSELGRYCCKQIEKATGIPIYYYLERTWGRKKGEENLRCPGYGKKWYTGLIITEPYGYGDFHFKCKRCRLVSHAGCPLDDRHARIGEYRPKKKKAKPKS